MNEKFRGNINTMEGQIESQSIERGLGKTAVKQRLHDLFAKGATPENITLEQFGEACGFPMPYLKKGKEKIIDRKRLALDINNQVRKLFPSSNRKEVIDFQYKLFKEEKSKEK
jgi:hypothetical protein